MNIFEEVTKRGCTFDSPVGQINIYQLWQLPLTSTSANRATLNEVAKTINRAVKALGEEDFVGEVDNRERSELQLKLDVVKHIIQRKLEAKATAEARTVREQELAKLTNILEDKKQEGLAKLTEQELEARIAALRT